MKIINIHLEYNKYAYIGPNIYQSSIEVYHSNYLILLFVYKNGLLTIESLMLDQVFTIWKILKRHNFILRGFIFNSYLNQEQLNKLKNFVSKLISHENYKYIDNESGKYTNKYIFDTLVVNLPKHKYFLSPVKIMAEILSMFTLIVSPGYKCQINNIKFINVPIYKFNFDYNFYYLRLLREELLNLKNSGYIFHYDLNISMVNVLGNNNIAVDIIKIMPKIFLNITKFYYSPFIMIFYVH